MTMRSMLFLPGNAPNLLINGDALGADALIFDLEDAVAPTEKDAARILVRNVIQELGFLGCTTVIRINDVCTPYWQQDLEELVPLSPSFILQPKVGTPEDIRLVDQRMTTLETQLGLALGGIGLIALLETALGIKNAFAIATACPRVRGLFLGAEDLSASLRCQRTKVGAEIFYARGRVVCAARAAEIDAYDTPFTDVKDNDGALADAVLARGLGFSGKASISPAHLSIINSVFSPSMEEIDYAYQVLEAIEQGRKEGKGAVSLRGKMIDAPIVTRATQTLELAREIGLIRGGIDCEGQ